MQKQRGSKQRKVETEQQSEKKNGLGRNSRRKHPNTIQTTVNPLCHLSENGRRGSSQRCGMSDCISSLRERNGRIFGNCSVDSAGLVSRILGDVTACLCSWRRIPASAENQDLCLVWGLPRWVLQQP
ncbi:hypothetical protein RHSIM_Rhsim07G0159400 [Rhododendron simsii]|uniref:Uncharacterized protein n=1 Tax=Rhododendron simsii TaxID=118357 RepID=A0A834LJX9_RHOSS|nr:hypothetical protein RHSIM_Rhsim07G0159400 [Rhododendron simsii]